jgi:transcriptional regulator with XRE-family HTH domain
MLQKDFAQLAGISQSFLTALLSDTPPWPSRATMKRITEITGGTVTANDWMALEDPPPRLSRLTRAA